MKPNTGDIVRYLNEITQIDSDVARWLSEMIKSDFERVMRTIETRPYLLDYVSSGVTEETRWYFCERLMSILAPGKYKILEAPTQTWNNPQEDKKYQILYGLWEEILYQQKSKKWWEGDMSYIADKIRLFFWELFEYCENMDPDADKDDTEGVRVYSMNEKSRTKETSDTYRDSDDYHVDEIEDDDWEDFIDDEDQESMYILKHEVQIIVSVLQIVSAYFDSIDQRSRNKPIRSVLLEEKIRWRWGSLVWIMEDITDVSEDDFICEEINKHDNFITSIANIMTRYTAFRINLD